MALLVKVDGSTTEIKLPKEGVLRHLYGLLDCDTVECLPVVLDSTNPDVCSEYEGVLSDETARITGKDPNRLATKMSGRDPHPPMYHILGDCVFYKEGEVE
ncbi:MAG: hypothetical protein D4S01_07360 [Dehalococcoidia bacterium]|nr:MAG: hypothetical protein D4S01_07360 [Dehalococcoidia bacterium]